MTMQVINPYINCIRAEKHLMSREGATVYLENTLISYVLWRDGKFLDDNKPNNKTDTIVERVTCYQRLGKYINARYFQHHDHVNVIITYIEIFFD